MSKLIKSAPFPSGQAYKEKKVISIKAFKPHKLAEELEKTEIDIDAQTIIADAQMEAEAIVRRATHEAELIKRQLEERIQAFELEKESMSLTARESGFASGYEEGREKGYKEYQTVIESAQAIVESAKNDYHRHVESSEREILEIGLKVAKKILDKTIQENEAEFSSIVKRALKEARDHQEIQLHIHPIHYTYLLTNKEELKSLFPKDVNLIIYPDEELAEFSCIIESVNGRIDASIESQIAEIKRKLIEMLEGE